MIAFADLKRLILKEMTRSRMIWAAIFVVLFLIYTSGLSTNPPGFYVDESGLAYNAYLVSRTGAGEFGPKFPLYFELFSNGFTAYTSPTQIYMLAAVFLVLPPSILVARVFSAFWVFSACILLGYLARRISGSQTIGVIVGATALLTPWFFDVRGLLLEPHFIPMAISLYLFVVWRTQERDAWSWFDALMLMGSLILITYCYTSGRVLGVLMAGGLVFFATSKHRIIGVLKTWVLYGVALLPIVAFNYMHPGVMTRRLYEVSYIRPGMGWDELLSQFATRYMQDQSLTALLLTGDYHPRHHVPGSGGAIFISTFIIIVLGVLLVVLTRLRQPWWRFVLYGAAAAIVPGALANEAFHEMRLMAYPVFLTALTIPALQWLLSKDDGHEIAASENALSRLMPAGIRIMAMTLLLAFTLYEAWGYQSVFRTAGPNRQFDFDVSYKSAYQAAILQDPRPIYLEDGFWGPGYIHALWYATVEGRSTSEFVHLAAGEKGLSGGIVISSEQDCTNCDMVGRFGSYIVYRVK